jgi:23S rRNA (adenine2503-C2)-methyltransferase
MVLNKKAHLRYNEGFHLDLYETEDHKLIEVAIYSGESYHKNIISISNQIGCPVRCTFCGEKRGLERNISSDEFLEQVKCTVNNEDNVKWYDPNKELKVAFSRTGEALLNKNFLEGLMKIDEMYNPSFQLITTLPDTKVSNQMLTQLLDNISAREKPFQIVVSTHTTNEQKRKEMIRFPKLMSFKEIGLFGEKWVEKYNKRKIDLNFALITNNEIDFNKARDYFHPDYFAIRLSVFRENNISENHLFYAGDKLLEEKSNQAKENDYECIISKPTPIETQWNILQSVLLNLRNN